MINNGQRQTMPASHSSTRIPDILLVLGALGLIFGVVVTAPMVTQGHIVFGVDDQVTWGMPVSVYIFFVLSSTGLTMVASLAMVFGLKEFYPIAKRCIWLALATLIAGFLSLGLEMGHPLRMLWTFPTGMQYRSPLFWMGVWYGIALLFMAVKLTMLQKGDWKSPVSKCVGTITVSAETIAAMTLGVAFGSIAARPFWYGPMVPIYMITSAALSGVAFSVLFVNLVHGVDQKRMTEGVRRIMTGLLPRIFAAVLGLVILFLLARTTVALWTNMPGIEYVMQAKVTSMAFHVELWLGMVLPLVLLVTVARTNAWAQVVAATLVLAAVFHGRDEFVVGGQLVPMLEGIWQPELLDYSPTLPEYGLLFIGASLGLLVYAAAEKWLNLSDTPQ